MRNVASVVMKTRQCVWGVQTLTGGQKLSFRKVIMLLTGYTHDLVYSWLLTSCMPPARRTSIPEGSGEGGKALLNINIFVARIQ